MTTQPLSLDRRQLLTGAAAIAAAAGLAPRAVSAPRASQGDVPPPSRPATSSDGPFRLMELPYPANALEPVISERTLSFHHGKHHKGYVDKTNAAVAGTDLAGKSLEDVVRRAHEGSDEKSQKLFDNAAQVWNHDFYWRSMSPDGGGKPSGKLLEALERDFGSFEQFAEAFAAACTGRFGSGYGWLVAEGGKLAVMSTANADLPLVHGKQALLTVDVWEHAYYLDHQNARADYVRGWLEHLANWEFAAENLG